MVFAFASVGVGFHMWQTNRAPTEAATNLSLFNANGTMNAFVANQLLIALSINNRDSSFRLFPDVGTGNVLSLSRANWRFVHASGNNVTFWMDSNYRGSTFNPNATVNGVNSNVFWAPTRASTLHDNMVADWNGLANGITGINNHVNMHGTTATHANSTNRLWLPTLAEVQAGGTWGLTQEQRSFRQRGYAGYWFWAWLRTPNPGASNNISGVNAYGVTNTNAAFVADSVSVRPALHLSLNSLMSSAGGGDGMGGGGSRDTHTVTWNTGSGLWTAGIPSGSAATGGAINTATNRMTTIETGFTPGPPGAVQRAGWEFMGWSDLSPVTANRTVTAQWRQLPVPPTAGNATVTMVRGQSLHNITVAQTTHTGPAGDRFVPAVPANVTGFRFIGWATDSLLATSPLGVQYAPNQPIEIFTRTIFAVWVNASIVVMPNAGETRIAHLYGVGGMDANNITPTWEFDVFDPTTLELPTTAHMNGAFRTSNPSFAGQTFMGWFTNPLHTGAALTQIPASITDDEFRAFARWV